MSALPALPTLSAWRAAYAGGAAPADLLPALRDQLAQQGAPVYLHVVPAAALQARLQELQAQAAAWPTPAARAAAMPLYGVPFVVKDNIDLAGAPTTAACPAFAFEPEVSATAVRKLLDAGAVCLAKTNLDQFATGLVGTRSPYGAPASVASALHISGGSSSGSAVAVARGDVPFSLGTDTAGSGRVPAGFNGIVGLKPTPGRVSSAGVLPACRTLDCISVFSRDVDDAAQVLAVIEGADAADAYSDFVPGPATLGTGSAGLRLGVPASLAGLSPAYALAFERTCSQAQLAGHRLLPLDFGLLFQVAALLYDGPWVAERHSVLRELLEQRPELLDAAVRQVVAKALDFSATEVFQAQYRLRDLAQQARALWSACDALLVPTAPLHPRFEEVAADPIGCNAQLGRYTNFVNLLGWCALAVPAGQTDEGLPFGVTLIAPAGRDTALAAFGRRWLSGATAPLPALWPASQPTLRVAVVGAHLAGLPLNGQLTERGATLRCRTRSAASYRLFALPNTRPPKPGLLRVASEGQAIELEVWDLPLHQVGSFLALVPSPLSLGLIELEDGSSVHGFLCEAVALQAAADISHHGGWRAYLASLSAT